MLLHKKKSNHDDSVNRNSVVTEVQQSSIKSIHFQNNNIELKIDDNINDCVIVEYDTDKELSPTDIVFTSGDKSIVTVEFDKIVSEKVYYVIKGISEGKTFLCASSNDGTVKSDEITVVVKNKSIEPKRVTLSYERDEIALGEKIHLNASVEPEEADIGLITWESSDSSVLVIDENGIISAVGGGTAVVLAKINGEIKDEYELKVNENVRKFKVSVGHKRDDNNNIGDEWSYYDSVNDNDLRDINHEIYLSLDESVYVYSKYTEDDSKPDVGEAYVSHYVTEDELINGFEITMDLYVTENAGKNSGESAHFIVTYSFSLK